MILSPKLTLFELNERSTDLAKSAMSNFSQMSRKKNLLFALKGKHLMFLCKTDDGFRTEKRYLEENIKKYTTLNPRDERQKNLH